MVRATAFYKYFKETTDKVGSKQFWNPSTEFYKKYSNPFGRSLAGNLFHELIDCSTGYGGKHSNFPAGIRMCDRRFSVLDENCNIKLAGDVVRRPSDWYAPFKRPKETLYWGNLPISDISGPTLKFVCNVDLFSIKTKPKQRHQNAVLNDFLMTHEGKQHALPASKLLKSIIDPSWYSVRGTIASKSTEDIAQQVTFEQFQNALKRRGRKLNLPSLKEPTRNDLRLQEFKPDSYSGFFTSFVAGRSKKQAYGVSLELAERYYDKIRTRNCVDTSIWSLFGREKRIDNAPGKTVLCRPVLANEFFIQLNHFIYSRPIMRGISRILDGKPESELYVGTNFNSKKFNRFRDKFKKFPFVLEADWSKFGIKMNAELIL